MKYLPASKQLLLIFFILINHTIYSQSREEILASEKHISISNEQKSDLLEMLKSRASDDYYVFPEIPRRKLRKACKRLMVQKNEVLLFIDAQLFGSGKISLIVGTTGIYFRNDWTAEQPGRHFIPFETFKTMKISKSIHGEIGIGDLY